MIGRPAVFPTGRPFGFDAQEYRDALVHIDAAHLEGIAAEMHGTAPGPLRFASAPGDTAPWWAAVRATDSMIFPTPLQVVTGTVELVRDVSQQVSGFLGNYGWQAAGKDRRAP